MDAHPQVQPIVPILVLLVVGVRLFMVLEPVYFSNQANQASNNTASI